VSRNSVWQLVTEKKDMERSKLEQYLGRLRKEHAEAGERLRYLDELAEEYCAAEAKAGAVLRFDDQQLAGRRYLVQLMSMKNAVTVKRMDLDVHIDRVRNALLQIDIERQRFAKLHALEAAQTQRDEAKREQREDDLNNLVHYNYRRADV
jgi:flagellar biosynthesis chaperone FliJ